MDYKITGYEPAQLFHFFEEVSAIPRGDRKSTRLNSSHCG